MTIHDFDMARYLVGDIAEVHAFGAVLVDPAIGEAGDIDSAMILLRRVAPAPGAHQTTAVVVFTATTSGWRCSARRHADRRQPLCDHRAKLRAHSTGARDVVLPFFIERYAEAYAAEISHFLECVAAAPRR
jgi:myo-inositol 2-dehydrogenase/D-chiro-inositol 1-dehydrogenase